MDWKKEARKILRVEMSRCDIGYKELVRKLNAMGIDETERSVVTKVSRGTFSAAFLLQCLRAMEVKTVDVCGSAKTSVLDD